MSPELPDALQAFPTVIAGVLGLIFGSFLNVCIHRLPQHRSVVHPGSACPACGAPIRWYDNIPVLSWLLLRGRCRDCRAAISFRYAFVELFVALLFIFSVRHFGLEWPALKFAVFGWLIIGLIFTDYETRLLPDAMTLPGALLGIIFSLLVPMQDVASVVLPTVVNLPFSGVVAQRIYSLADGVLAVILTAGFLYVTRWLYLRFRGVEGLGLGDVKLIAMIGFFLGLRLTLTTLLLASVAGAFAGLFATLVVWVRRSARRLRRHREPFFMALRNAWGSAQIMLRSYPLPFGVFLGGAALLAALFG